MKLNLLIVLLLVGSTFAGAQTREELLEEYRKERNKMMSEILKIFNQDMNSMMDDDFFSDDVDSFFDKRSFTGGSSEVVIEQKYEEDGSIAIVIIPQNKHVQLDISTDNNMITVKSETKVIEENEEDSSRFKSFSSSSMSRSISIPQGYTAKQPVAHGKGIKISLIPSKDLQKLKQKKKPLKKDDGKMPIQKQPGEQTI